MPYVLGVDIGNSFTTAATAHFSEENRQPASRPVKLGGNRNAAPSVAFVAEGGYTLIGEAAERAGVGDPERVIRGFRQRIGDPVAITIGELRVAAEDVYAAIVRWVVDRAEELEGEPPDAVSLTHPASWGSYRIERVRSALAGVDLGDADLVSEPEAALRNYATSHPDHPNGIVAVYDLGGTTFDVAILRGHVSDGCQILGEPGHIEVGGADFDDRLFRVVAGRSGDAFSTNDAADANALQEFSALRRECALVKEDLSFRFETSVEVPMPGVRSIARVVRSEFEAAIAGLVRSTIDTLRQTLDAAGVTVDDLDVVLLVGGSSHIPLVARHIADDLGRPTVADADPAGAFASGAALASAAGRVAAMSEAHVHEPDADSVVQPATEGEKKRRVLRPVIAIAKLRFRPGRRAVRVNASLAPVAVAAVVAGLILTVVAAQAAGISALSAGGSAPPGAEAGEWLPETLRTDGPLEFPFVPQASDPESESDAGADATPIFWPPPNARAFEPVSDRSGSAAPRQGAKQVTQAPPRQPTPTPSPTPTPAPEPTSPPEPTPEPVPDPVPDPNPNPAPDPVLDPNPDPAPEPDPAPDPDPELDPAPEPVPAPAPDQPVNPVVGPLAESGV